MADKKNPTPNDQRSNVKNPNNSDFKQDRDHRSRQMNPDSQPSPRQADREGSMPGSSPSEPKR